VKKLNGRNFTVLPAGTVADDWLAINGAGGTARVFSGGRLGAGAAVAVVVGRSAT
jgi:hypothetical protein